MINFLKCIKSYLRYSERTSSRQSPATASRVSSVSDARTQVSSITFLYSKQCCEKLIYVNLELKDTSENLMNGLMCCLLFFFQDISIVDQVSVVEGEDEDRSESGNYSYTNNTLDLGCLRQFIALFCHSLNMQKKDCSVLTVLWFWLNSCCRGHWSPRIFRVKFLTKWHRCHTTKTKNEEGNCLKEWSNNRQQRKHYNHTAFTVLFYIALQGDTIWAFILEIMWRPTFVIVFQGEKLRVEILSLTFEPSSNVAMDKSVQRVYVEYRLLGIPMETTETPMSLRKPTKGEEIHYNFTRGKS